MENKEKKQKESVTNEPKGYLEKKYGIEPKINEKDSWNWH